MRSLVVPTPAGAAASMSELQVRNLGQAPPEETGHHVPAIYSRGFGGLLTMVSSVQRNDGGIDRQSSNAQASLRLRNAGDSAAAVANGATDGVLAGSADYITYIGLLDGRCPRCWRLTWPDSDPYYRFCLHHGTQYVGPAPLDKVNDGAMGKRIGGDE